MGSPECDIDPTFEIKELQREVALVVIHAHNCIEALLSNSKIEKCVWWKGTFYWQSVIPGPFHSRCDVFNLFAPKPFRFRRHAGLGQQPRCVPQVSASRLRRLSSL